MAGKQSIVTFIREWRESHFLTYYPRRFLFLEQYRTRQSCSLYHLNGLDCNKAKNVVYISILPGTIHKHESFSLLGIYLCIIGKQLPASDTS